MRSPYPVSIYTEKSNLSSTSRAALRRRELDEGARRAPAGDRAPAFQVLDDALADQRERPAVVRAEDGDRENQRMTR
jgi:hypothetical protein